MVNEEAVGSEEVPIKTPKQLEKEAKKLAKLEKFKQKQDKKDTKDTTKSKDKAAEVNIFFLFV